MATNKQEGRIKLSSFKTFIILCEIFGSLLEKGHWRSPERDNKNDKIWLLACTEMLEKHEYHKVKSNLLNPSDGVS